MDDTSRELQKSSSLNTFRHYTCPHSVAHPLTSNTFCSASPLPVAARLTFCTFRVLLNTSSRKFFRVPQDTSRELKKVPTFEHFSPFRFCFYCHKDVPGLLPLIRTGYQRQGCLTTFTSYPCFKQRQRFRLCCISLQFLRTVKRCLLEVKHGHIGFQYCLLWSSIFVTLMANKIGGLQFGIYRNCQISSRVFHTAVAALPLTKANRSDFE